MAFAAINFIKNGLLLTKYIEVPIMRAIQYKGIKGILLLLALLIFGCSDSEAPTAIQDKITMDQKESSLVAPTDAYQNKKVIHHASLGSADICEEFGEPVGCDQNYSIVANKYADGSVSGQYQDVWPGGGKGLHANVDCLRIVGNGNAAIVGGIVTKGTRPNGEDLKGNRVFTALVDNGTSANDPPDQAGFTYHSLGLDCSDVSFSVFEEFDILFDINQGQVKVW